MRTERSDAVLAESTPHTDAAHQRPAPRSPRRFTNGETALARSFKALGDPTRLRVLSLVAAHENGEASVTDLTEPLGLGQPTVSHHLKILVDAGLLTRDKRGVWSIYSLVPGALGTLGTNLSTAEGAWSRGRDLEAEAPR
ncbi:metalloregulator ArsR/SmtB family transcription factor [Sanguibacter sp. 25GB23B1]|uniref:ArsR/SmtB family transcription factor n=1 Tax=unclassified Sanguibacter TaxID=2645534 RepID=UPI0032AEFEAD